jgi:CheY-like chemotaxis protein
MNNNSLPIVLHADDDPNDLLLFKHACQSAHSPFLLESVGDGELAIAYLSGQNNYADRARYPLPALVLLDLKMPRRTGFEVLDWIRAQSPLKRVPVIILTSSKHEADINWTYEHGANSYLVKPVGFEALVQMVQAIEQYWLTINERPSL